MTTSDWHGDPDVWPTMTNPLIPKPDWFDEMVADWRESSRERWFLPDGRHRAYVDAPDGQRS